MPYCAQCRTEYRKGVEVCADCGEPLVDDATWEAMEREEARRRERLRDVEMATAWQVGGRIEADRLLRALEQEGIPGFVRSYEETAFDGLFVGQRGWGEILVPAEQVDQARALIEALEAEPGV